MDYLEKLVYRELGRGDPHSPEYHFGMLDALRYREKGSCIPQRYELGTAQADAYYAGSECGHALWRRWQEEAGDPAPTPREILSSELILPFGASKPE
jgi:hypothetical protein